MYIATGRGEIPSTANAIRAMRGNVVALGLVSLVTDVSSEMVTAVLPLYLVLGLGLSPLQFGVLDGLHSAVAAVVRLISGHVADRWGRLKATAGIGYALSAVSKLGLLAAGASVGAIGLALAADRTGKGLRTAPRDALISLSSEPASVARSFGVHRAMDTAGALLGPLVAMGVLRIAASRYEPVFFTSFCIGTAGVLLLVLFVRDVPRAHGAPPSGLRVAGGPLRHAPFRRLCGAAASFGLVTVSDSFVYLLLQRRWGADTVYFPLLPLGSAASFLLFAIPLGHLADRFGRWRVFLGGHVALLAAFIAMLGPIGGALLVVTALTLHGVFYAATDGVLMAAASALLPEGQRAGGMAWLQTGQASARMLSSMLFGAIWSAWGERAASCFAASGLGLAVLAGAIAVRWRSEGVRE